MKDKKLTEKQDLIFSFIKNRIVESGFPPTVREIGEEFNITVKGAYDHMKAIEKKGFIRTEQNKSRAIVITDASVIPNDSIPIPLLGRIAAGTPILAEENISEYLSFSKSMIGTGTFFALEVKGDSMIDAGIINGDIAIIRQQQTADNGEIVAAMIDDEATLKKLKLLNGRLYLVPENKSYKPIVTDNATILGKLTALFRSI